MAAPTGTQQLPQEKYAEELSDLDEGISVLQVLYEKYFLGIDREPPEQERKRISEKARELRTRSIRMWDRTLREIEEGTYKRDVFKAKLRAGDRDEPRTGPVKPAAPSISDANLRRLYDTYVVARKRCGEATDGLTFDSMAARIRSQVPELMQKHKAKNIEFKVVIKGGKAILKAVPHT